MNKKELRTLFLKKRNILSEEEIFEASTRIFNLLNLNFNLKSKKICCFLPIKSKNEIDTTILLKLSTTSNFEFHATKWNLVSNSLSIHKIDINSDLVINDFGIPEPTNLNFEVSADKIDIVIVPLLTFDKQGNRVGYGKGVYDQFLKKFNSKKTSFIGLSFFEPIEIIEDIYENDIKLTHCITPKKIYNFEKQS
jgi:5-formyltetrahydrofolate cyclo-ligase